jgi:uncharacterized membrane protein (DUF485 family)
MRAAQKLLGATTIGGGVPGQGVVVEGVKGVKYTPMLPGIYVKIKNRRFCVLFGLLIAINVILCSKVLNKIYSRDVF